MSRLSSLRVVDPVLTNLAIGYTNAANIYDQILPVVDVPKEAGVIPTFPTEAFRPRKTVRALRAESNQILPDDFGSLPVILDEHDLAYPIDYREDYESAFPLQQHALDVVMRGIELRKEVTVAGMVQDASNYASGNSITLSGDATAATAQLNKSKGSPETVISNAKNAVRSKIAIKPNVIAMGYAVWEVLRKHPELRGILGATKDKIVTLEEAAQIFGVSKVVVGEAVAEEAAGQFVDLWGKNIVLAYVPETRDMYAPAFGYTLRRTGGLTSDTYESVGGKVQYVRATDIYKPYILGNSAGYLIKEAVS